MTEIEQYLARQMAFSKANFGPGVRTVGVLDHMEKEITEVRESGGDPAEWTDLVILAFDGLTRSLWAGNNYEFTADVAGALAWDFVKAKYNANELRDWPDWRGMDPDKAIEHVRDE